MGKKCPAFLLSVFLIVSTKDGNQALKVYSTKTINGASLDGRYIADNVIRTICKVFNLKQPYGFGGVAHLIAGNIEPTSDFLV